MILPGWRIVGTIGVGSYGKVYEVEKVSSFGVGGGNRSAIKVISVPPGDEEYDYYMDNGYDEASVTAMFKKQLEKVDTEFKILEELKGNSNIVSYEDHDVVEHENHRGWDIFIRMELLTTLTDYLNPNRPKRDGLEDPKVDDEFIIRMGSDLCRALELCQKHNVIHRDIKPSNVFVNKDGFFKLGDFGIARMVAERTRGTSRMGTPDYMAPEVYNGKSYDIRADICSLGLLLYWLLNGRRTPFLPLDGSVPTPDDKQRALSRRVQGEVLPPPQNGSRELQSVVLKACAWNPKDRFESPKELREALNKVATNGLTVESAISLEVDSSLKDAGTQRVLLTAEMIQKLEELPNAIEQNNWEDANKQKEFFEAFLKEEEASFLQQLHKSSEELKGVGNQLSEDHKEDLVRIGRDFDDEVRKAISVLEQNHQVVEKEMNVHIRRKSDDLRGVSSKYIQLLEELCREKQEELSKYSEEAINRIENVCESRTTILAGEIEQQTNGIYECCDKKENICERTLQERVTILKELFFQQADDLMCRYAKVPGWEEKGVAAAEVLKEKGRNIVESYEDWGKSIIQDAFNRSRKTLQTLGFQEKIKCDVMTELALQSQESMREQTCRAIDELGNYARQGIQSIERTADLAAQKIDQKKAKKEQKVKQKADKLQKNNNDEQIEKMQLAIKSLSKRKPLILACLAGIVAVILLVSFIPHITSNSKDEFTLAVSDIKKNNETEFVWVDKGQTDITALKHANNILKLDLTRNRITDINPINSLTSLVELRLNENFIEDISCINWGEFEDLTLVNLSGNAIVSIAPLDACPNLKTLALIDCELKEVSSLKNLTALENLYLSDNQITSLSSLKNLKNLKKLYLNNNPNLTLEEIHALKNSLPECEFYYDRIKAEKISIEPSTIVFSAIGKTATVKIDIFPVDADADVIWTSSNQTVATIDDDGVIHSVSPGSCTISASADSATATVSVSVGSSPKKYSGNTNSSSSNNSKGNINTKNSNKVSKSGGNSSKGKKVSRSNLGNSNGSTGSSESSSYGVDPNALICGQP